LLVRQEPRWQSEHELVTALLSRLLFLFPKRIPHEDLFTEAVARIFERNPQICLDWLRQAELISAGEESKGARRGGNA
jgi:hypothetical protein